jgi:hypothetical protein
MLVLSRWGGSKGRRRAGGRTHAARRVAGGMAARTGPPEPLQLAPRQSDRTRAPVAARGAGEGPLGAGAHTKCRGWGRGGGSMHPRCLRVLALPWGGPPLLAGHSALEGARRPRTRTRRLGRRPGSTGERAAGGVTDARCPTNPGRSPAASRGRGSEPKGAARGARACSRVLPAPPAAPPPRTRGGRPAAGAGAAAARPDRC